ncbi:Pfdn6 [Symbiodinium sp. CCMP2456]|nr:Pfdn6 [Symbiodinium sp. CCMP2456]
MESSDSDASSRPVRDVSCCAQSRWVQQAVRVWFCYCYPLCFLAASLLRPATSVSAIYSLIAFLVLFLPACRVRACEASSWRRLHLVLGILALSLLIVAGVMLALCRHSSLEEEALVAGKLMFFGIEGCMESRWIMLPEVMATVTACLGCLLGRCARRTQASQCRLSAWSNPLKSPWRLACVTLILFCSASLHFNMFAVAYHFATVCILILWAVVSPFAAHGGQRQDNYPCASGLLRMILFVASAAHVIVAALLTVSVPVLPFEVPERVSRLLGLEVTPLMALQQMASFLLLELILWPSFPAHEATKKSLQVPRGVSEELRRMEANEMQS